MKDAARPQRLPQSQQNLEFPITAQRGGVAPLIAKRLVQKAELVDLRHGLRQPRVGTDRALCGHRRRQIRRLVEKRMKAARHIRNLQLVAGREFQEIAVS